jgi:acid phosphatase
MPPLATRHGSNPSNRSPRRRPVGLEQLNAISWMQTAKEYPAITRAAYRRAIDQLPALAASCTSAADEQPASPELCGKGKAIVMDIDETVLDNSAYFATLAVGQQTDDAGDIWEAWVAAREAPPVPGAVEFIRAARSAGFHVLVRFETAIAMFGRVTIATAARSAARNSRRPSTISRACSTAPVDPADLYLRYAVYGRVDDEKNARRSQIAAKWRIAMLVGDDLRDFVRSDRYDPQLHDDHWSRRLDRAAERDLWRLGAIAFGRPEVLRSAPVAAEVKLLTTS